MVGMSPRADDADDATADAERGPDTERDGVDPAVAEYLGTLDEQTSRDAESLIGLLTRISGRQPRLWNVGTIGFGTYHYRYDSGREGDAHTIGFYPRRGRITVYLMDGTARHAKLLTRLGPHSSTGYCLYLKRLGDVDATVLEGILHASFSFVEAKAHDGAIREILWKT